VPIPSRRRISVAASTASTVLATISQPMTRPCRPSSVSSAPSAIMPAARSTSQLRGARLTRAATSSAPEGQRKVSPVLMGESRMANAPIAA
jgi:hypothetical protein